MRLTHLGPVAQPNGHDGPGLVGELDPGVAAVIDDIVVTAEDPIGEPVLTQGAPQMFSAGSSSAARAGPSYGLPGQLATLRVASASCRVVQFYSASRARFGSAVDIHWFARILILRNDTGETSIQNGP